MVRTVLTGLAMAFCIAVPAQVTPDQMVREFFGLYSTGKAEKAIDELYGRSEWLDRKSDDVRNLKMQLLSLGGLLGEYRGYQLLGTKDLLSDLVVHDYMVKYDRQPVRFRFSFYRARSEWAFYGFSFDDQLDEELKQAVKAIYLHP